MWLEQNLWENFIFIIIHVILWTKLAQSIALSEYLKLSAIYVFWNCIMCSSQHNVIDIWLYINIFPWILLFTKNFAGKINIFCKHHDFNIYI